ncbi:MAG: NACHT domain-containing protein [Cyanobacteria bacterium SBLK]|nr:NACHT domain-containing protein [Cyanobacteria bacterium SBLK]
MEHLEQEYKNVENNLKISKQELEHLEQELEISKQNRKDLEQELEHLEQELEHLKRNIKKLEQELESIPMQCLLRQGKLLFLIDGLDEAQTNKLRQNMQEQLCQTAAEYPKNRFILTCRTQVMETTPIGFTLVEVADFEKKQVEEFVQNWFKANGKSESEAEEKGKEVRISGNENPYLQELMITPVLLSLICLILQNDGEIPFDRVWLYERGIKLLLNQWNEEKHIENWEVGTETYRRLEIERKEDLLLEIAAHKFRNPKNFVLFRQERLVEQIAHRLGLKNLKEGLAVLRAIETQHGLLIERADELWSFSHLTLQEYFAFKYIDRLSPEGLIDEIADPQWQKIVRQLMRSQQPADRLVKLIRRAIDKSVTYISRDREVNQFFNWIVEKSDFTKSNCKTSAIRAFYYTFNSNLSLDLSLARTLDRNLALALDDRKRTSCFALDRTLFAILGRATTLDFDLDQTLIKLLDSAINRCTTFNFDMLNLWNLQNKLRQLRKELITATKKDNRQQWWQANRLEWIEKLRQITIEHRNIGHNWQFSYEQKHLLEYYYNANKFLSDLLKIEGAVSEDVRREQENTLLLPPNNL